MYVKLLITLLQSQLATKMNGTKTLIILQYMIVNICTIRTIESLTPNP